MAVILAGKASDSGLTARIERAEGVVPTQLSERSMSNELVYAGSPIGERDDQLCLTDMWRAVGGPEAKRPNDWLSLPGPTEFTQVVADSLNAGLSGIIESERGRLGGTWAHWQIGLAYAKYLSPEFHMWCNNVVRVHMERRHAGGLSIQVERMLGQMYETVKDTNHTVKQTYDNVVQLKSITARTEQRMNDVIPRKDPSEKTKRICLYTIHKAKPYQGCCPCGCGKKILDDNGRIILDEHGQPLAVPDHWYSRERNGIDAVWWVFRDCNQLLRDDDYRKTKLHRYNVFHEERKALQGDLDKMRKTTPVAVPIIDPPQDSGTPSWEFSKERDLFD